MPEASERCDSGKPQDLQGFLRADRSGFFSLMRLTRKIRL
ncbi:hypothetical protein [Azospirillum doebereinerae]